MLNNPTATKKNYKALQKKYINQPFACMRCGTPFEDTNRLGGGTKLRVTGGNITAQCGECASKVGGIGEQVRKQRSK